MCRAVYKCLDIRGLFYSVLIMKGQETNLILNEVWDKWRVFWNEQSEEIEKWDYQKSLRR